MNAPTPPSPTSWPVTRIGAITFNVIVTLGVIIIYVVSRWFWKRRLQAIRSSEEYTKGEILHSIIYQRWCLWSYGVDVVKTDTNGALFINLERHRNTKRLEILSPSDVMGVTLGSESITFYSMSWALVSGLIVGLWSHFWPCVSWSCDWGVNDHEDIRGAIWFSVWFVTSAVLIMLRKPVCNVELAEQLEDDPLEPAGAIHVHDHETRRRIISISLTGNSKSASSAKGEFDSLKKTIESFMRADSIRKSRFSELRCSAILRSDLTKSTFLRPLAESPIPE